MNPLDSEMISLKGDFDVSVMIKIPDIIMPIGYGSMNRLTGDLWYLNRVFVKKSTAERE